MTIEHLKRVALRAADAFLAAHPPQTGPGITFPVHGLYLGDSPAQVMCYYGADCTGVPVFTWAVNGRPAAESTVSRIIEHTRARTP